MYNHLHKYTPSMSHKFTISPSHKFVTPYIYATFTLHLRAKFNAKFVRSKCLDYLPIESLLSHYIRFDTDIYQKNVLAEKDVRTGKG